MYTDAETGFVYLRARYYDPATGQFLTRDPLEAMTRSPYGYVYGNPLNGTDSSGLLCVTLWDKNCESFAQQHAKGAQQVANFAGGVLNTLTFGNERRIDSALGVADRVDRCSGYYTVGEVAGAAALLLIPGAGSAAGDEVGAIRFSRFTEDQDALIQLAKEAKRVGGLGTADAETLLEWAEEVDLNSHEIMTHAGRSGFGGTVPHITVGPVRHIPVFP